MLDNPLGIPPQLVKPSKQQSSEKIQPQPSINRINSSSSSTRLEELPNSSTLKEKTDKIVTMPAVAASSTSPTPLDLSNRATPQGWSEADEDSKVVQQRTVSSSPPPPRQSLPNRPKFEGEYKGRYSDDRLLNERARGTEELLRFYCSG